MKKILIFDIDGTLLLTGGTGHIAFERAFEELYGIPDSWGNTVPDGKTDHQIFGEIFTRHFQRAPTREELLTLFAGYTRHFELEIDLTPGFRVMPGIPSLLSKLEQLTHITLGIATGNIADVSHFKLRRANLQGFFRFMGTASDSHDRPTLVKHAIERGRALAGPVEPQSIFVIGDAAADVHAAKKNGVRSIAVATGGTPKEVLAGLLPDYLLDDLSDPDVLLRMIH